jgi:hypothetical protein
MIKIQLGDLELRGTRADCGSHECLEIVQHLAGCTITLAVFERDGVKFINERPLGAAVDFSRFLKLVRIGYTILKEAHETEEVTR